MPRATALHGAADVIIPSLHGAADVTIPSGAPPPAECTLPRATTLHGPMGGPMEGPVEDPLGGEG